MSLFVTSPLWETISAASSSRNLFWAADLGMSPAAKVAKDEASSFEFDGILDCFLVGDGDGDGNGDGDGDGDGGCGGDGDDDGAGGCGCGWVGVWAVVGGLCWW